MSEQTRKKPLLLEVSNSQEVKEEPVSKSKKKNKNSRAEQKFKGEKEKDHSPFGE